MAQGVADKVQPTGMRGYELPVYPYRTPPELRGEGRARHPVVVVGAGLAGLTLALELGLRGIAVVVLDEDDTVGAAGLSSRGICYAQRTLEILDRLGIAGRMMAKGVTWNEGRVFLGREEIYAFDLQTEPDQKFPAFINLQQFYVEQYLVERIAEVATIDLRWKNRVVEARPRADHVELAVETPEGGYTIAADWLAACDGGHSLVRAQLGLEPRPTHYETRWCIADIRMDAATRTERRFWLEADFAGGGSVILHRMADDIWRTDWQISHFDDPEAETTPARAAERIRGMLGADLAFEPVWIGPWRFKSRVMDRFVHGRVLFAGDSAHEYSPFGARGGNSGIQDVENLAWKLALVIDGDAAPDLLETYSLERQGAARENLRHATRSALFIGPETAGQRLFRNAALALARHFDYARPMVNTGRLSTPNPYPESPLNVTDRDAFAAGPAPGTAARDGVVATAGGDERGRRHLIEFLGGAFTVLCFVDTSGLAATASLPARLDAGGVAVAVVAIVRPGASVAGVTNLVDASGALFGRYDADGGACYLLRPDSYVLARARGLDLGRMADAVRRCVRWHGEPRTSQ